MSRAHHPSSGRIWALVLLSLASACTGGDLGISQDGPPVPTVPRSALITSVRGVVIDATTGAPVAGASVSIDVKTTVSGIDGTFAIYDLLQQAATIETIKVGYDTARTFIPLSGGEYLFSPRLRPSAPVTP